MTRVSGVAKAVGIEWQTWGDILTGTREQLVAASLVSSSTPFPGDPGQKKASVRARMPDGKPIKITRAGKSRFSVWRHCSPEEEKRRDAQWQTQLELQKAARMRDPGECRKEATKLFENGFYFMVRSLDLAEEANLGWTYAADDRVQAMDLLRRLMGIVKLGQIIPRAIPVSGEDEGFRKFIDGLSGH